MGTIKVPSKDEIKAARAKRKEGLRLVREANRVLYRKRRARMLKRRMGRVRLSARFVEQQRYETWCHDYSVLLRASVRADPTLTAEERAAEVMAMADRMAAEVEARRPVTRGLRARRFWANWQDTFDNLVHDLAEHTGLSPTETVDRACALADAMFRVIADRRPGRRRAKKGTP